MDDRILVMMPTVKDGDRTRQALSGAGLECTVCGDLPELCREIARGAGAALLTEESVARDRAGLLQGALRNQAHWSDLPLVVLARERAVDQDSPIRESMNATLVERPVKVRSLVSVLRAALRSRRHQYDVRDHLADREQAEEARARLAAIVQSSDDAMVSKSLDGTILTWNAGAEALFGYTAEEAIGRHITLIIPQDRHEEEQEILAKLRRGERVQHFETVRVAKDGRMIDISLTISPIRSFDGHIVGASKVARDISDQKIAEAKVRKQTERLSLLWEAASVLLTTEEPDAMMRGLFGKIAPHFGLDCYFNYTVNETDDALRLESFMGVPEDALRPIRRVEFGQAVRGSVARTRGPITATGIALSEDPMARVVKLFGIRAYACNPLAAGKRLLGTLAFGSRTRNSFDYDELEFLRTICHYVTLAYERLRMVRELRDGDRKKNDFIALLAHELRNPLAPIRNGLQVLRLAETDADARVIRTRSMMDRQLEHMVRLIDDLLDVNRINRNKMELRRERVALADVINTAVETAGPFIEAAGHRLNVSLPNVSVFLDADLTRLAQVFGNLLTNSAKYTARGGRIFLSAERQGQTVVVSVRDTGIGIPPEYIPKIFDMFSQVDRSIERSAGGLGIGLALVKGLVEMHGGTVTAFSAGEGRGSTFTVILPALEEHSRIPVVSGPDNGQSSSRSKKRILVVDDSRDGAESLAMLLRILGNEVSTANDGAAAIEVAEQFRPEVILMDVGMPRLNGLDATRRIREREWAHDIAIIALTGWGQSGDRERSRQAGCNGHLVKPVDISELNSLLAKLQEETHTETSVNITAAK
jgi:PAS domain S-box-containing protein